MSDENAEKAWGKWHMPRGYYSLTDTAKVAFMAAWRARDAEVAALRKKLAGAEQTLIELKPDPVLVEGSWFAVNDLPTVLGNFIRSSAEYARDAKALAIQLESERTRADKAETSLTNLEAGFKSFMRSHNQLLDENERLREVIERAKEYPDLPKGLWNLLDLAAVPVEPQGDHEGGQ